MAEENTGEAFVKAQQEAQQKEKPTIQIYVVDTAISSENRTAGSEQDGDWKKITTFSFPYKTRKEIQAIRMKYGAFISYGTLKWHKTTLCSEEARPGIEDAIKSAKADMEKLREEYLVQFIETSKAEQKNYTHDEANNLIPKLGAQAKFLPLDLNQIFKGSLYGQITDSIKYQVYSGMFARMETMLKRTEEGKELPERSRNALIKVIESMRSINVTKDENIYKQLDAFKAQIEKGELKEVAASLKAELDAGKSRWAAIEL